MSAKSFGLHWDPDAIINGTTPDHILEQIYSDDRDGTKEDLAHRAIEAAYPHSMRFIRELRTQNEYVYCIHAQTEFAQGLYKFGKTKDVLSRIKTLQTGSPFKLELVFYTDFFEEKYFHEWLAEYRHSGEWFKLAVTPTSMTSSYIQFLFNDARLPEWEINSLMEYLKFYYYEAGIRRGYMDAMKAMQGQN